MCIVAVAVAVIGVRTDGASNERERERERDVFRLPFSSTRDRASLLDMVVVVLPLSHASHSIRLFAYAVLYSIDSTDLLLLLRQ